MVSQLRPGIGKKNVNAVEGRRTDHVLEHFHCVVLNDTHVPEPPLRDQLEQAAHAGGVHFDAEVVVLGVGRRNRRGRLAHAETDLEQLRRGATEFGIEIKVRLAEGDSVAGQELRAGALLGVRDAALAQHVAADRADAGSGLHGQGRGAGRRPAAARRLTRPSGRAMARSCRRWDCSAPPRNASSACARRGRPRARPPPPSSSPRPSAPDPSPRRSRCS